METYLYTLLVWLLVIFGLRWVVDRWTVSRWVVWIGVLVIVALVSGLHRDTHAIGRMVVICVTLLALMKVIVYAEWRRQTGKRLSWARWLMFSTLWFGMDPSAWAVNRRNLKWRQDALVGLSCLIVGWGICVLLVWQHIEMLVLVFIPMSLAFHFGALRLLTAFWRLCGIPVRPLFRNPLVSLGLADFWSARWNISFSQMMARVVRRPLQERSGAKGSLLAVFLVSGFFHELAITLPVQSGYGGPFLYFMLHGCAVLIERDTWPLWLKRSITLLLVVLPLPLLFPETFTQKVILPCLQLAGGTYY